MPKTILIADDKANIRNLVREYLEAEGFRIVAASDGRKALYAARQEKPDLILLCSTLGNLISNALRYTPEGGEIRLTARQAAGGMVLGVQDTGGGISPEILPHIFERSYRGDAARQGNESGLGLSIAKSIVELHGGRISAESGGIGKGAQFSVFFP